MRRAVVARLAGDERLTEIGVAVVGGVLAVRAAPDLERVLTAGRLDRDQSLELSVASDALAVFSDGGEADRLSAARGQRVTVGLSSRRLRLVVPPP